MTTYIKNFIGKGTQVEGLDIVKVFIAVENLEACTFEKDGKSYVGFEIAKMLNPDKYGRTHTVYYTTKAQNETPAEKPSKKTRKKKEEPANNDLPF